MIRHIQNLAIVRTVYSGIIQAYSGIFRSKCYACMCNACKAYKLGIFRILEYLERFHNCISTHIQNPAIFTKIGKRFVTLEIQNTGILTILEYSEPWHIWNPTHIQNPLKDLRWSVMRKHLKAVIIFPQGYFLDLWQGSEYAHLSISTHFMTWQRPLSYINQSVDLLSKSMD